MKIIKIGAVMFLGVFALFDQSIAADKKTNPSKLKQLGEPEAPRTFCRFVPERKDDFAWENDKVAFRVYGPRLRKGKEDSGVDCWLKRVDYPIINRWYKRRKYHQDHGEGHDPYHVGSSRGCGGLGLWIDDKLITSNTYTKWQILKCEPQLSEFVLTYEWNVGADSYKEEKQISLKMGDRLFKSTSTFWKNGKLAVSLPIAIGLTTHGGKAQTVKYLSNGWVACWEKVKGHGLGTGVLMNPASIKGYKEVVSKKKDKSHAFAITETDTKGQVSYYAGYGWEKAGEIKTSADWTKYLSTFKAK